MGEEFQSGWESGKQRHRIGVWGMYQEQGVGEYGVKGGKIKEIGLYSGKNVQKQEKQEVRNLSAVSWNLMLLGSG